MSGGDDYEILCAIPEASIDAFTQAARKAGVAATPIGAIIAGSAVPSFPGRAGQGSALKRRSFSHF